jgi:hypothetical protein
VFRQKNVLLHHNVYPSTGELDDTVRHRKKSKVTSHADIKTRLELRAALADDD